MEEAIEMIVGGGEETCRCRPTAARFISHSGSFWKILLREIQEREYDVAYDVGPPPRHFALFLLRYIDFCRIGRPVLLNILKRALMR
jgi:hypothetical protein